MAVEFDRSWMWHPNFSEERTDTAGSFVHFKKTLSIAGKPPHSLKINITADTRYKLCINGQQVAFGPVKGDSNLWFFDEVDIASFLKPGENQVAILVLRFFYATSYAKSFARLPSGGVWVKVPENARSLWTDRLESSSSWETAIDPFTTLRIDEVEDRYLNTYEHTKIEDGGRLDWVPARVSEFKNSTGECAPWHLSPRMIPQFRTQKVECCALHKVDSTVTREDWETHLVAEGRISEAGKGLLLPAGTQHYVEVEFPHHLTAFLRLHFKRPETGGGILRVTYSESFEDEPEVKPWVRRKENRRDFSKSIHGPKDIYQFRGKTRTEYLGYHDDETSYEIVMPFHYRTFRFLKLELDTGASDLILQSLEVETVNYPLDVTGSFEVSESKNVVNKKWEQLWDISIRTLVNCMHDCYEDCPFYEQLQYAMDVRSSALFTYCVSGDDRLAKQAIIQLHNSFQSRIGLTASRAPCHGQQFIPHFSLYWINMVTDHFAHAGDKEFVRQFLPVVDSILSYFDRRIGSDGLVTSENRPGIWNFVDWTTQWKPHGIPPSTQRSGVSTFMNQLYAYTLHNAANLARALGRTGLADEYKNRAIQIVQSLRRHCFNGELFADTILSAAKSSDYSQHCQTWAVLSGCVQDEDAQKLLRKSLQWETTSDFAKESISFKFYTMRALSLAGGDLYDELFHKSWGLWETQLSWNVTTWVEDDVSQRSDCHAWGSVPLYELLREVVGIAPREPGWKVVEFRPRLGLFRNLQASCPLKMIEGKPEGIIHVSWVTTETEEIEIRLNLESCRRPEVPFRIVLPGKEPYLQTMREEWKGTVREGDCKPFY